MKNLTRMVLLCAVLTAFLYAAAYAGSDGASVQVINKPTVSGHGIGANDLDGLAEIAVPVQVSSGASTSVKLFASFYDGNGKYIGMGATSASVDRETSFVIMPVENVVTGAETLKMAVTDADFRPLSVSSYSLTGGGGGSGGGSGVTATYYLNASANLVDENGLATPGYLMTTEPTEDTDLSEAYPFSVTLQQKSVSPFFNYYVIFTPKELAYPRIIQGPASGVARVPVTLKAAPDAVVYRIWTYSGSSVESDAPTVTMKGAFRRDASGGGGGSSSGGGGSSGGGASATFYYALTNASVTPTAADNAAHGKVFLLTTAPTTAWTLPAPTDANDAQTSASKTFIASSMTLIGYAVFVPDTGYELDAATIQASGSIANEAVTTSAPTTVTLADGATKATYFSFTATGKVQASMPGVTITAAFKQSGGLDHENETPVLYGAFG